MDLVEFEKIVNSHNGAGQLFQYLRSVLNPICINISYNTSEGYTKYILSVTHSAANYKIPMVAASNGLVFTIKENKCHFLAIPARGCAQIMSMDKIPANSQVYPLQDGTTMSLYYDKKWMFGSRKSFDIYNTIWRGVKYGDIIDELMANFNYDALNKNHTYHLLFKHSSIHPYDAAANFVQHQSTAVNATGALVDEDIGLPRTSLVPVALALAKNDQGMGFIIRSPECDYKYESPLRRKIVKYVYQAPFIKNYDARKVFDMYFMKKDFFVVNNFMNFTRQVDFLSTFPQYGPLYDKLQKIVDDTVKIFMNKEVDNEQARKFHAMLKSRITDAYDPQNADVVKQLVMNVKYATILFDCI